MKKRILSIVLAILVTISLMPTVALADGEVPDTTGFICFSSASEFTLKTTNGKYWDGTLEYSSDNSSWTEWNGSDILTAISSGSEYVLYLRGKNNTHISGSSESKSNKNNCSTWKLDGTNISCSGNIENLLDYTVVAEKNHPNMGEYCFYRMFEKQSKLISAPELPATTLAEGCYRTMFSECVNLISAPELPATILADSCYFDMFGACYSLVSAPELPATTLAEQCYCMMFADCTSLGEAPELPATTLLYR